MWYAYKSNPSQKVWGSHTTGRQNLWCWPALSLLTQLIHSNGRARRVDPLQHHLLVMDLVNTKEQQPSSSVAVVVDTVADSRPRAVPKFSSSLWDVSCCGTAVELCSARPGAPFPTPLTLLTLCRRLIALRSALRSHPNIG